MKTSIERLQNFYLKGAVFLKDNPANTKLGYAVRKMMTRCEPHFKGYDKAAGEVNELAEDARALNCAVDKDGVQLRDTAGNYRFTPEGDVKTKREIRKIMGDWELKRLELLAIEVEIEPFIVDEVEDLNEEYLEVFGGLVIAEKL